MKKGDKILVCQTVEENYVERIFVVFYHGITFCEEPSGYRPYMLEGWEYAKPITKY